MNLTIHLTQTKTQKVGTLAIKNKKIYFEYDKSFLKTGIELSPYKLPLKAGLFICKDDTFDGLWGLNGLDSILYFMSITPTKNPNPTSHALHVSHHNKGYNYSFYISIATFQHYASR